MKTDVIIGYEKVCKSFDKNVILNGVDLSILKGETMTIVGGSGTGKSVMLKLLLALIRPDSGNIYFENQNVIAMKEQELIAMRRDIGMLFQSGALFDSLNVAENVAYPVREHFDYTEEKIAELVREKLALVGLEGIEEMMPADLSGGMKKRVSLARSIATNPKVILYDEPTTGLDPANTKRINCLIRDLQEKLKVTSIVVTHDMESAFYISDRMAMLYNQCIEFVGSPDEAKCSDNRVVKSFIKGEYDMTDGRCG